MAPGRSTSGSRWLIPGGAMAKIHVDLFGAPIQYLKTEDQERRYPDPPFGTAETLEFDLDTNPEIGEKLDTDWRGCQVLGGQFVYRGVAQAINAPSVAYTERKAVLIALIKLRADQLLTAAEVRLILRVILRRLGDRDT